MKKILRGKGASSKEPDKLQADIEVHREASGDRSEDGVRRSRESRPGSTLRRSASDGGTRRSSSKRSTSRSRRDRSSSRQGRSSSRVSTPTSRSRGQSHHRSSSRPRSSQRELLKLLDSALTGRQEKEAAQLQDRLRRAEREGISSAEADMELVPLEGLGDDIIPGVVKADKDELRQLGLELLPKGKLLLIDSQVKVEGALTLTLSNGQCLLHDRSLDWLLFKNPGELKSAMAQDLEKLKERDPVRRLEMEKAKLEEQVAALQAKVEGLARTQHSADVERPWIPLAEIPDAEYKTSTMSLTDCRVQMKKIFKRLTLPSEIDTWFQSVHQMYRESGYPKPAFVNLIKDLVEIPNNTVEAAFFAGEILTDVDLWNKLDTDYGSPFSAHHLLEQAQALRMSKDQMDGLHFHVFARQLLDMVTKALSKVPHVNRESRKAMTNFLSVNTFLQSLPPTMAVAVRDKVAAGQLQTMEQAVESAMNYAKIVRHTQPQRRFAVSAITEQGGHDGSSAAGGGGGGGGGGSGSGGGRGGAGGGGGGHNRYSHANRDHGHGNGQRRSGGGNDNHRPDNAQGGGAKGGYKPGYRTYNRRRPYACRSCQANRSTEPCTHCYNCLQENHRAANCPK